VIDKNVYRLGEIDTYRSNSFLYLSVVRLCLKCFRAYRDDIEVYKIFSGRHSA